MHLVPAWRSLRIMRVWLLITTTSGLAWAVIEPYDPQSMSFAISPDQATAAVRQWSGAPELVLTLRGVRMHPERPGEDRYLFVTPDADEFLVRCDTGLVSRWINGSGTDAWAQAKASGITATYSPAQIGAVATAFANQRFPAFGSRGMQAIRNDGHSVEFVAVLPGPTYYGGHHCRIDVNEYTGSVIGYMAATGEDVTISTQPSVNVAQAEAAALGAVLDNPAVATAFTTEPTSLWVARDEMGLQRLAWVVPLAASTDASVTYEDYASGRAVGLHHSDAHVDALTAEVYGGEEFLGSPHASRPRAGWRSVRASRRDATRDRRAAQALGLSIGGRECLRPCYPPVLVDGSPWIPVACLGMKALRSRVVWCDGSVQVALADGRTANLQARDRAARRDVAVGQISAPMRILHSRAYVSPETWELLTGWKCTFLPAKRMVTLAPPGAQQTVTMTPRP